MLDLIAHKAGSGDLFVNLARRHLAIHEWGEARMAVESGLSKGGLSDRDEALRLHREILQRLGRESIPEE